MAKVRAKQEYLCVKQFLVNGIMLENWLTLFLPSLGFSFFQ